jgi:multidrug resistance efflux pump
LPRSSRYTDINLPTVEASRVRIGFEARIVLDADPNRVISAKVVFVRQPSSVHSENR